MPELYRIQHHGKVLMRSVCTGVCVLHNSGIIVLSVNQRKSQFKDSQGSEGYCV